LRIVVTGANGFVGAHVVRELKRHHEVLAIDNLRYGPWRFSARELEAFRTDTSDIRDRAAIKDVIAGFDPQAIIHLAAVHFIPECERLPDEAVSINVQGTVNLLLACPSACRFVNTSSAAVYAPKLGAHLEREDAVGPVDVYGFTKLQAEEYVRYFTAQKNLQSVIVRLFNVVGPGETNPHVLPEIIKQLKAGGRRLSLGNLQPKRDYIYVLDVAEGFIAAATRPMPKHVGNEAVVVNLGSGKSYSVEELVNRLATIVGDRIEINIDPQRVRKVDRPDLLSNNTRMSELFAWTPRHDIDQALSKTWANPDFQR
jgi:UDP-glucose 4-epimerase